MVVDGLVGKSFASPAKDYSGACIGGDAGVRCADPTRIEFAVPIDELDELRIGPKRQHSYETGISATRCGEGPAVIEFDYFDTQVMGQGDTAVFRSGIDVYDTVSRTFRRLQAKTQPFAFVTPDHYYAGSDIAARGARLHVRHDVLIHFAK